MITLQILSPEGITYNDTVDEVLLPTDNGEIAILPHHVDLFSKLSGGIVTIKKGGKETMIAIIGGFVEVGKGIVTILSDYAVKADSIQLARAQEAKKKAEELMKNKESDVDFALAEKEFRRSILELKVAEKIKHKL